MLEPNSPRNSSYDLLWAGYGCMELLIAVCQEVSLEAYIT